MHKNLIGKAGVALATYHLLRLGCDVTATAGNSLDGDLWVSFPEGVEKVEVKSTLQNSWNIRADQAAQVSRFMFIIVNQASCWMIDAASVRAIFGNRKRLAETSITLPQLMATRPRALHEEVPSAVPRIKRKPSGAVVPGATGNRVIVKTLRDGTVKRYEYAPYGRQDTTATDDTTFLVRT